MKKLLLINTAANTCSTGRIAEEIGQTAQQSGYESYFAYSRMGRTSTSKLIRIGNNFDIKVHGLESRLFDNHGFASRRTTKKFIKEIERIQPDVINIHNLHGYYLNIEILLEYLKQANIPIVWTLHDCWPFTGHCSYFDAYHCEKWKTHCEHCPNKKGYPSSILLDRSRQNFDKKKALLTALPNVTFVPVCRWMANIVSESFMKGTAQQVIYNGTNLEVFKPQTTESIQSLKEKYNIAEKKIVLGVASVWDKRKGLNDFSWLNENLSGDYQIVLVGLSKEQIERLPQGIIGINRTENVQELAAFYSAADVFVNPTYIDNFPTTNIEALACGTPVVTYKTGGSPEAIDELTGIVAEQGNLQQLKEAIEQVANHKEDYSEACQRRAEAHFNKQDRFQDYVSLFDSLIQS